MKNFLLSTLFALALVLSALNAQDQDSVIYYPTLNDSVDAPGYTIVDINKPAALEGSSFWWDNKIATRTPPDTAIYDLGYVQDSMSWSHRIRGYDKDNYYICETWFLIDPIDLTSFTDAQVTFFNFAAFALGEEGSEWLANLDVFVSTDYTNDVASATWDDVTSQLDTMDQRLEYDDAWVKSTLDLTAYARNSNVNLGFRYTINRSGTVVKDDLANGIVGERPGGWTLSEVRFTGTYDPATSIGMSRDIQTNVYPNPATDYIYFDRAPSKVRIYDVTGQEINIHYTSGSNSLNVSGLAEGTYILRMTYDSGEVKPTKLIKR